MVEKVAVNKPAFKSGDGRQKQTSLRGDHFFIIIIINPILMSNKTKQYFFAESVDDGVSASLTVSVRSAIQFVYCGLFHTFLM